MSFRILSSGRRLETERSVDRVLSSGRRLTSRNETPTKKQRTQDDEEEEENAPSTVLSSRIQVTERKRREHEPTKKLLLQAVSDANKSVRMTLKTNNGVVKVINPDGTSQCLTTKSLAKRLKAKEPTWVDPTSLSKMKIRVRNEFCTNPDEEKSIDPSASPMEFQDEDDDDDDEFVVVVNNDYEGTDEMNNIWMVNDYPSGTDEDESNKGNGTLKRKLSEEMMSDDQDQSQDYSPPIASSGSNPNKKTKRCRFWPDCHLADQCEYVHPSQRCIHFPNCIYGSECLYIHPTCRFAMHCTRVQCPYVHSASTPASSPSSTTNANANPVGRPAPSIICKYGIQCMRPNCLYTHPRVPMARNLKWVNTKWRASDDTPLLPPTSNKATKETS